MTEHVTGRTQAGAPDVDVSVVLPTFNERDNICDLAEAIRRELTPTGCRYEILVVDDSSPDGTADVVRAHFGTVRDPRGADTRDDGEVVDREEGVVHLRARVDALGARVDRARVG